MSGVMQSCLGCGQSDDHPKHQVVIPPNFDSVFWHMDCHLKITGCDICAPTVLSANGKTGEDFRTHIVNIGKKG